MWWSGTTGLCSGWCPSTVVPPSKFFLILIAAVVLPFDLLLLLCYIMDQDVDASIIGKDAR